MTATDQATLAAEYEAVVQKHAESINTLLTYDIVEIIGWLLEISLIGSEQLFKKE